MTAAWWRLVVGSLATGLLLAASGGLGAVLRVPRLRGAASAAAGGLLLFAHLALWLESLRHMSVASSTGIVVSYPVIAAAVEAATGGAGRLAVAGAVLGFSGVAVLSTPWAGATPLGSVLAFLAAVAAAAYFLAGRRLRAGGMGTLEYTLAAYGSAAAAAAAAALLLGVRVWAPPRGALPFLVLLGLVPMLLGHSMLNYALGFYPASTVTTVALLEPYGASLLAWLLLGETPPPAAVAGLALTVPGALLSLRDRRGRRV